MQILNDITKHKSTLVCVSLLLTGTFSYHASDEDGGDELNYGITR